MWETRHDHDVILGPAREIREAAIPHRTPQVSAYKMSKWKIQVSWAHMELTGRTRSRLHAPIMTMVEPRTINACFYESVVSTARDLSDFDTLKHMRTSCNALLGDTVGPGL